MIKKLAYLVFGLAVIMIGGCTTNRAHSHIPPSYAGIRSLRQVPRNTYPLRLAKFTSSVPMPYLPCAPDHKIKPKWFSTFPGMIRTAMIKDLKFEKLYSSDSKAVLYGNLDKLKFNASDFKDGYWYIKASFSGNNHVGKRIKPFTVESYFYFNVKTTEKHYCRVVAENFAGALRIFIANFYNNHNFHRLIIA